MAATITNSVEASGAYCYVVNLSAVGDSATCSMQADTIQSNQPIIMHCVPDGNDVLKVEFSPHPAVENFIESTYGNINATISAVLDFYAGHYRVRKQSGTGTGTKVFVTSPVPLGWKVA